MGMYYRGLYTLSVNFDDLVLALIGDQDSEYLDLVLKIGNNDRFVWSITHNIGNNHIFAINLCSNRLVLLAVTAG
jgi:hypothetical protein